MGVRTSFLVNIRNTACSSCLLRIFKTKWGRGGESNQCKNHIKLLVKQSECFDDLFLDDSCILGSGESCINVNFIVDKFLKETLLEEEFSKF